MAIKKLMYQLLFLCPFSLIPGVGLSQAFKIYFTDYHSAGNAITDSPAVNYDSYAKALLTLVKSINLGGSTAGLYRNQQLETRSWEKLQDIMYDFPMQT